MVLKRLEHKLTVCKTADLSGADLSADFYFIGKTNEELSLVCRTEDVPAETIERDDGCNVPQETGVNNGSFLSHSARADGLECRA